MKTTTAPSTAFSTVACGSATSWALGHEGTGLAGRAIPVSARPRVRDRQLHMVAISGTNVWPSSRSGRCSG